MFMGVFFKSSLKKKTVITFKADRNRGGEEVGVVSPIFGHDNRQMKF